MDELDRPDVDAAGRLGREQHRRPRSQLPGHDDLLLVAPGQRSSGRLWSRGPDVELPDQAARPIQDRPQPEHELAPGKAAIALVAEDQVAGHRVVQDQARAAPVLGDVGDARGADGGGVERGDVTVAEPDPACGRPAGAGQHLHQLALPVALDAGDAEDLARSELERDALQRRYALVRARGQVVDRHHHRTRSRRLLVDAQQHLAPDHQRGDLLLVRVLCREMADHTAAPHHRDAVGDVEDLLQLVADEDDRLARFDQVAQHHEQLLRLLRREHAGRLVEDEDVRAAVQHLHDLRALLQPDRQVTHARVGVKRKPVTLRQVVDRRASTGVVVEVRACHRLAAQHDVLADREHGDQHEMLVHHADAQRDRVARPADVGRLAVDEDLA